MRPENGLDSDSLTREEFIQYLRDALNHLHHANLRQSPLATLFGVAGRFDTASALRRILTEAIASLKPTGGEPDQARAWLIYDCLFCYYVQQLNQQVVADQLSISVRQLRREQSAALDVLADIIWKQFVDLKTEQSSEEAEKESEAEQGGAVNPSLREELAWLKNLPPEKPTDLKQELSSLLELTESLAAQQHVGLKVDLPEALPGLAIHPIALSQTLLNLLSVAIRYSSCNQVAISAQVLRWEVEVIVRGAACAVGSQSTSNEDVASLQMAHQLADLGRCKLAILQGEEVFLAKLTIPALEQLPVLVIDDSADTLQLLQRYAMGSRYRLISTRDPEKALDLAEKFLPQIIVLDVMMPQVDGWKVLGRLRQNPLTTDVPILVCTILPQETLALSLGASGFIRKPVNRQAFLSALDQQIGKVEI